MATTIELKESRTYNANSGVANAERVFLVNDVEDEAAIIALMDGTNLPAEDDLYPASSLLPSDLYFYDFSIAKMPENARCWRVTARYKPREEGTTVTTDLRPNEVGYRTVSGSLRATFQDLWRDNSSTEITYPTNYIPGLTTDISGTKIDFIGRALSTQIFQQTLTIDITDGEIPNMGDDGVAGMIGTRNDAIFLGAATGQVVFMGCNFTRVPDVHRFSISYEFLFDSQGHLIQYPLLDSGGRPALDATQNAEQVMFRQPFPLLSNFMTLSQYFSGL
jgi:hypothetical protein